MQWTCALRLVLVAVAGALIGSASAAQAQRQPPAAAQSRTPGPTPSSTPSPAPSSTPASPSSKSGDGGDNAAALIIAAVGIVVSGLLGPWLMTLATRGSDRQRFERDRAAVRRDDLRQLLDEAAALLASGASNMRDLHAAARSGAPSAELDAWAKTTFTMSYRLRLRLLASHAVVTAYDAARDALARIPDASVGASALEQAVDTFEQAREAFMDEGRQALDAPVATEEQT